MPCYTQAEKVEQRYGDRDDYSGPEDRRIIHHLVPPTRKVKEHWFVGELRKNGHKDQDGKCPEKAFKANHH